MARSPRLNNSANALHRELISDEILETHWEEQRRRVKAIPYKKFADEILALPTSFRRRVAFVLREFGEVTGARTTRDIEYFKVSKWVNWQLVKKERYCETIVGLLEVLEVISAYAKFRRYIKISPFDIDKPNRWFPNGTFEPRERYLHSDEVREILAALAATTVVPVAFGTDGMPVVLGKPKKAKLSKSGLKVVRALIDAGDAGLTKPQMLSIAGDAINIVKRLASADEDWAKVVHFPVKPGDGYRIGRPALTHKRI